MNKLKLYSTILLVIILGGCLSKTTTNGLTNSVYPTEKFNVQVEGAGAKQITGYLVKETSYNGKKLKMWIDTSQYTDSSKAEAIKLGQQFLNGSNTNDIYHWITGVFGDEWGTTSYNDLIKDEDTIHILVTPLNSDYSGSFVMGYFNPKDTLVNDGVDIKDSNQKTMFYIDSKLLTGSLPNSWSDKSKKDTKKDIYSTLAHEFVHMINWYQKDILKNVISTSKGTDTWLNETLAMMGEDLVDDKITVDGVLGISGSKSRIPEFNYEFNTLDINDKVGSYDIGDYAIDGVYGL